MFNLQKHSQQEFAGAVGEAVVDERSSIDNPAETPISTDAITDGFDNPEQEVLFEEAKNAALVRQLEILSNDSVQGGMANRILARIRDDQRMGSYPSRYDQAGRAGLENRADEMGRPDLVDMALRDRATVQATQEIQQEIARLTRYDAQGAGMANAGRAAFNLKTHKTAQVLEEARFPVSNTGDFIEKYVDDLLAFNNEPGTPDYERARVAYEEIKAAVSPGFEEEANSALESIIQLDPMSERDKASQSLIKVYEILLPPILKDQEPAEPEVAEPMVQDPAMQDPAMQPPMQMPEQGMMAKSKSQKKYGQKPMFGEGISQIDDINKYLAMGMDEEKIVGMLSIGMGNNPEEIRKIVHNVVLDTENRKKWQQPLTNREPFVDQFRNSTMSEKTPEGIVKFNLNSHILNNTQSPVTKTAADQFGQQYLLYGPTEKRVCPKLRGKNMSVGDVVSEYICRHHCLDGLVIDDNKTICGEALWRANAMDKFSRDYVDADGNLVGGYLNKRFETNRNVDPENKMRLKPGETRKPRPASQGSYEARLQDMRAKEGKKRDYRPDVNTGDGFDWCHDQDQNNVGVSQEERERREKAVGHQAVQYTNKEQQENPDQNKQNKKGFNLKIHKTANTPQPNPATTVQTAPGFRPDTFQARHDPDHATPVVPTSNTNAVQPAGVANVQSEMAPKQMPNFEQEKYNFSEGKKRVRAMSDDALAWTRKDLLETIDIQEQTNREDPHANTPKLGFYHDQLGDVVEEIKLRRQKQHMNSDPAELIHNNAFASEFNLKNFKKSDSKKKS